MVAGWTHRKHHRLRRGLRDGERGLLDNEPALQVERRRRLARLDLESPECHSVCVRCGRCCARGCGRRSDNNKQGTRSFALMEIKVHNVTSQITTCIQSTPNATPTFSHTEREGGYSQICSDLKSRPARHCRRQCDQQHTRLLEEASAGGISVDGPWPGEAQTIAAWHLSGASAERTQGRPRGGRGGARRQAGVSGLVTSVGSEQRERIS